MKLETRDTWIGEEALDARPQLDYEVQPGVSALNNASALRCADLSECAGRSSGAKHPGGSVATHDFATIEFAFAIDFEPRRVHEGVFDASQDCPVSDMVENSDQLHMAEEISLRGEEDGQQCSEEERFENLDKNRGEAVGKRLEVVEVGAATAQQKRDGRKNPTRLYEKMDGEVEQKLAEVEGLAVLVH